MCCRYTLSDLKAIAALVEAAGLGVDVNLDGAAPRHNVALTQRVPVITKRAKPKLETMSFGLLLPARPPARKPMLLPNARAETLLTKQSFLDAAQHRRCLVPANGFYEWEKQGATRLPHYFTLPGSPAFFFAGLWEPETATTPPPSPSSPRRRTPCSAPSTTGCPSFSAPTAARPGWATSHCPPPGWPRSAVPSWPIG